MPLESKMESETENTLEKEMQRDSQESKICRAETNWKKMEVYKFRKYEIGKWQDN